MKKIPRLFLTILIPSFVLFVVAPRFIKADDATSTDITSVNATSTEATSTVADTAPLPQHITLTIRDNNTMAYSGSVILPDQSAADILVTPTNSNASIAVSPRSLLGVLELAETSSSNFNITNLQYYPPSPSFPNGSFLLNCILVPLASSTPDCYNWHDTINGLYPNIGIDQQMLQNGDNAYLFSSVNPTHQTILSKNSVLAGESFTATAEQFDPQTDAYKPLTGVTLGAGTSNTDYTFTELATSTVDTNGQAVFLLNTTGTFSVGIKEDYYYPSALITITDATSTQATTTLEQTASSGGDGGISHSNFNIPGALAFISGGQNLDGSFNSPISTDWTAIAFSAEDPGNSKTKLKGYLLNSSPTLFSASDYERHAMALESLDINPYSGTAIDCITPITNAFDGTQIGTPADNDDIFALLPLEHAGFTPSDLIIQKEAAFILSTQYPNGSWDGTPDMTAAAMQALGQLTSIPKVSGALGKAAGYLASTQTSNGGWDNIDSTSWVQTAINGLIETRASGFEAENVWTSSSGLLPADALAASQQTDGGVNVPANRVWSTGYAVVAASGKSWTTILNSFPKQDSSNSSGSSAIGEVLGTSTSTADTLTSATATSTPKTASTTLPVAITIPAITMAPAATTATIISGPKFKLTPPRARTKNNLQIISTPASAPALSAIPKTTGTTPIKTNFFERLWQTIMSFFHQLF